MVDGSYYETSKLVLVKLAMQATRSRPPGYRLRYHAGATPRYI